MITFYMLGHLQENDSFTRHYLTILFPILAPRVAWKLRYERVQFVCLNAHRGMEHRDLGTAYSGVRVLLSWWRFRILDKKIKQHGLNYPKGNMAIVQGDVNEDPTKSPKFSTVSPPIGTPKTPSKSPRTLSHLCDSCGRRRIHGMLLTI